MSDLPTLSGDKRFDVIVVGAGTAGIPVALEAADAGARVALVDKRPLVGGMLHLSSAHISGAGTQRQRERHIDDSPEAHLEEVMRLGHNKANRELVALSVPAQREAIDWLDNHGFQFRPDTPSLEPVHELYSVARTYIGLDEGRSYLAIFERELNRRIASGNIALFLNTRVTKLLQGPDSSVQGVRAEGPESATVELLAGRVALASGGYAANRELVRRFVPAAYHSALTGCLDYATGDGLRMAEELGARATDLGYFMPAMGLMPDPARPGFTVGYDRARVNLFPAYRKPYEVWVNLRGERFIAEDTTSSEEREKALVLQPELKMAIVWDQQVMDEADPILTPGWTREQIEEEASRGVFLWKAPTLDALAGRLHVDAQNLAASIATYNTAVDAQRDPRFGRTILPLRIEQPPFYGLTHQGAMLTSREGLRVDGELRVLGEDGRPIVGLYAVGEVLGASQFMGDSFVGGMIVGPAVALGRLLGQRLGAAASQSDPQE